MRRVAHGRISCTPCPCSALTITARALPRSEPNSFPHVIGAGLNGRYWQMWWTPSEGWGNGYRVDSSLSENWTTSGTLGNWSSLVSVYDGSAVRLYVDGVEIEADNASSAGLDDPGTPLYIGDNPTLSPREFDGLIDEVRIASVARSSEWIVAQHRSNTGSLVVVVLEGTL